MKKFIGVLSILLFAFPFVPSFGGINPKDIMAIWLLDEGSGKEVKDFSGNGHHGEIVGNAKWTDGKFGKALEFAGGHVRVQHAEDMNLETFSLAAWINVPKIVDPYQFVVGKESWPSRNYSMWIRPGTIVVGITDGGDRQVAGASVVGGIWHHVAGTYNKEFLRIYVDGVQNAQIAVNTKPLTCEAPLMIGAQPPAGNTGQIQGIIDEVIVLKVGIKDAEIKEIMEKGLKALTTAVNRGGKLSTTWAGVKSLK